MTPGRLLEIAEQHPPELDITDLAKAIARKALAVAAMVAEECALECLDAAVGKPVDHAEAYVACAAAIRKLGETL